MPRIATLALAVAAIFAPTVVRAGAQAGGKGAPPVAAHARSTAHGNAHALEDDWPGALARAKAQDRLIFIDAWAPWCHTCRFMRAAVLPEVQRGARARQFVWLSIDTENPANAPFLEAFPVSVWPTFLVVDPRDQQPVLKWLGSAKPGEVDKLLADALRARGKSSVSAPAPAPTAALARAQKPVEPADPAAADAALVRADRAQALGHLDEALVAYRQALAAGGADWPARSRTVASLVIAESVAKRFEDCAATSQEQAPHLPRDSTFANVVGTGLSCALEAPPEAAWRKGALAVLEPLAREALAMPDLLADDHAALFDVLAEARAADGDEAGARRLAEQAWAFLEAEERRPATPETRAALDSWRVSVALRLQDPARALPALEASEHALPADYNPPARRAYLLRALGKLPEARAAVEKALKKAYGPRKLKLYQLQIQILEAQGDRAALSAAVDEALASAETFRTTLRDEKLLADLRARRAALDGGRAP